MSTKLEREYAEWVLKDWENRMKPLNETIKKKFPTFRESPYLKPCKVSGWKGHESANPGIQINEYHFLICVKCGEVRYVHENGSMNLLGYINPNEESWT